MRLKRKTKTDAGIPTSSLPDIIFMLLIFFMVVTVLREFQGLKLILPEAKKLLNWKGKSIFLIYGQLQKVRSPLMI